MPRKTTMNSIFVAIKSVYESASIDELRILARDEYDIDAKDKSKEELIDEMMSVEQSNYFK